MILCHSLSINDELIYTKYIRKISTRHKEDRRDRQAHTLTETFKNKSIAEAIEMKRFKTVQDFFDLAMQMSIETQRELVSFDLINFAVRSGFQMAITEKQMHVLIENKMYEVIEALINSNSLLKIDQNSLDAEELMEVAQIRLKEHKKTTTMGDEKLSANSSHSLDSHGGDVPIFEGGRKNTSRSKAKSSHAEDNNDATRYDYDDQGSLNSIDRELLELEQME